MPTSGGRYRVDEAQCVRTRPRPARLHREFGLARLMVQTVARGRANAVLAYPFYMLIALSSGVMGQLYEAEDGQGVVSFGRDRLWSFAVLLDGHRRDLRERHRRSEPDHRQPGHRGNPEQTLPCRSAGDAYRPLRLPRHNLGLPGDTWRSGVDQDTGCDLPAGTCASGTPPGSTSASPPVRMGSWSLLTDSTRPWNEPTMMGSSSITTGRASRCTSTQVAI